MAFGRSKGSDLAVLGDDNDNGVPPPPAPDLFDPSVIEAADEDAQRYKERASQEVTVEAYKRGTVVGDEPNSSQSQNRKKWFIIGAIVLLAGIAAAAAVLGTMAARGELGGGSAASSASSAAAASGTIADDFAGGGASGTAANAADAATTGGATGNGNDTGNTTTDDLDIDTDATPCVPCTDVPTQFMADDGVTCATYDLDRLGRLCGGFYCQYSCFDRAGIGHADFSSPCCPDVADPPTSDPTALVCPILPYAGHDEDDVLTIRREGRPDRYFRIYTPSNFDPTQPAKVVFMHHGWSRGTYCQGRIFLGGEWRDVADTHGYVLVAVDGLAENDSDAPRSYTFPGSADGLGRDGVTTTTCNVAYGPDYCYPSCEEQGRCANRCGWTHCLDDDVQLFVDLVEEVAEKYVCIDRRRVYVYGYSMGGMFSWSLAQDPRSAPLIAGVGAAQGLPMHDHLVGRGHSSSIPAIGIYGDADCSVPPGDGTAVFTESCQGTGYHYVDAFHQHRLWAQDHGCTVGETHPARFEYRVEGREEVECASHCDPAAGPPMSVDCRSDDEHGKEPWHLDIALKFFEHHWLLR